MSGINSLNDYIASNKQNIGITKTATRTTVGLAPYSLIDLAGSPGAGVLAGANTAAGGIVDDTFAGIPPINAFAASGIGSLTRLYASWDVTGVLSLYDRIYVAGPYPFNTDTTLAGQPSYAARLPGGSYNDLELWFEAVTAFTGNPSIEVNYLDQGGAAGDTGAIALGFAPTVGRMFQLPLAAGDSGLQQTTRIRGTVATVGTFNIAVMRPLGSARIDLVGQSKNFDMLQLGQPQVFAASALHLVATPDSTSSGHPYVRAQVANL